MSEALLLQPVSCCWLSHSLHGAHFSRTSALFAMPSAARSSPGHAWLLINWLHVTMSCECTCVCVCVCLCHT